jgi:hypothetical protein
LRIIRKIVRQILSVILAEGRSSADRNNGRLQPLTFLDNYAAAYLGAACSRAGNDADRGKPLIDEGRAGR